MFDIYTIIFLALAVFIFLRLRSVLGQRTGRERPPYDPYSSAPGTIRPASAPGDKVVALPGRAPDAGQKASEPVEAVDRWKGIAEPGSALATGLDAIAREDKSFDVKHFLTGARAAYDMIVTAYAAGDRKQLKSLLGKEVYDGFETAIKEREQKGETVETRFVAIDGATLTAAEQRGKTAQSHGAFPVAARLGDARQGWHRDRRQSGCGDRRHRCLDLRARRQLARSQLEAGRHRSRAMTSARLRRGHLKVLARIGSAALMLAIARRHRCAGPQSAEASRNTIRARRLGDDRRLGR